MAKFVIDANGLAPIAEALSGRSRVAGVAAGLKNKILAEELDAQRVKTMRGRDEYDTFRGLMDMPQGEPVSAARAIAAFGGDGESYAKAAGKLYDNQYRSQLGDLALAEAKKGNLAGQNQFAAGYEGRTHSPYRVDGYGQTLNQDTGAVGQTAASQAKINNINASSDYHRAGVDLRGAQTQNEMQKTVSEILRGQGYELDNQGKVVKLQEMVNPQTGATATKAPDANDARLFTALTDDGSGRMTPQVDHAQLQQAYLFAQQHGYPTVSAALPAFKQWQQEQEYITTRAGSDKVINDAIHYGGGNLTPVAQAAVGDGAQATLERLRRNVMPQGQSGAQRVVMDLHSHFGKISPQNSTAVEQWLRDKVAAGQISQQEAGMIWQANQ